MWVLSNACLFIYADHKGQDSDGGCLMNSLPGCVEKKIWAGKRWFYYNEVVKWVPATRLWSQIHLRMWNFCVEIVCSLFCVGSPASSHNPRTCNGGELVFLVDVFPFNGPSVYDKWYTTPKESFLLFILEILSVDSTVFFLCNSIASPNGKGKKCQFKLKNWWWCEWGCSKELSDESTVHLH